VQNYSTNYDILRPGPTIIVLLANNGYHYRMNAQNTPVNKEVSTLQPFDNIIDYAEYLDWYLNLFINGLRKDHTDTGDSWLADQTEFIKSIAETDDREICADYLAIGSYGMKMVIQLIDCDPLNYGVVKPPESGPVFKLDFHTNELS